jgi:serine/threonine protein phosphatase PrpC
MLSITDIDSSWGVAQCQQRAFEDRYQAKKIGPFRYFAIFDGHGSPNNVNSDHVVDYLVHHLHERLAERLFSIDLSNEDEMITNIQQVFIAFDRELYANNKVNGSTCTIILIDDEREKIYQINLGDSRSIIFNDKIISATEDHHPMNEVSRILEVDGIILMGRIDGCLAVSRAFGDFEYKYTKESSYDPIKGVVNAMPDIKIIPIIRPISIILTSDAPYEERFFTDQSLVNMFQSINIDNLDAKAMDMILRILPKTSDDTTLILIRI